jgi:hypothetical protein
MKPGGVDCVPLAVVLDGDGLFEVRRTDCGLAFAAPPLRRSGPLGDELTRHIAELLRIDPEQILGGNWVQSPPWWLDP